MPPKADNSAPPTQPAAGFSGKVLIIGIFIVALVAAGTSWWFRYNSTHRTLTFWGPVGTQLIRDAPAVAIHKGPLSGSDPATIQANFKASLIDVSQARGLVHLRNALLVDRSFDWKTTVTNPPLSTSNDMLHWRLLFDDPVTGQSFAICFPVDCRQALWTDDDIRDHTISTQPIAAGLREMFAEFVASRAAESTPPASPADPGR